MNKNKTGIFLMLLLAAFCLSSCGSKNDTSKVLLNEVLVTNESNFQDDYGVHSAWIEVFNKSFGSVDLAGYQLKISSRPGDTLTYNIPKGDILTSIKPRQHALFWADGQPTRGTFHTSFILDPTTTNWVGLYDNGKNKIDEILVPANIQPNQSYGRIDEASGNLTAFSPKAWEVKDGSDKKYVTPSTNNQTLDKNAKIENFEQHDEVGIGMSITAMSVVFCGLILLYISFKVVGNMAIKLSKRNAMKAHGITDHKEAKGMDLGQRPGEVFAAIAMAMHEYQEDVHDVEDMRLTINKVKRTYSPWSSKIYMLRETPNKR